MSLHALSFGFWFFLCLLAFFSSFLIAVLLLALPSRCLNLIALVPIVQEPRAEVKW